MLHNQIPRAEFTICLHPYDLETSTSPNIASLALVSVSGFSLAIESVFGRHRKFTGVVASIVEEGEVMSIPVNLTEVAIREFFAKSTSMLRKECNDPEAPVKDTTHAFKDIWEVHSQGLLGAWGIDCTSSDGDSSALKVLEGMRKLITL